MHQIQFGVTDTKRFEILDKFIEFHPKFSVISFTPCDLIISIFVHSFPLLAVIRPPPCPLIGAVGISNPHKLASVAACCWLQF